MRIHILLAVCVLVVLVAGCDSDDLPKNRSAKADTARVAKNEPDEPALSAGGKTPEWLRTVIMKYLNGTDNEQIRSRGADNESWLIDNVEATDSGKYISIQIGHDVAEADGSEPRFVTDQWIGVDSATRTIYEYDVARDTSVVWRKNGR